jgi:hypothetical protein
MELAGLLVSSVGFLLTLTGVGIAIHQANAARKAVGQSNDLLERTKLLAESHSEMSRLIGEISVIDAYMARELGMKNPDFDLLAKQYGALLNRAIRLMGSELALRQMVGELSGSA